jgi:LysM repeat protein
MDYSRKARIQGERKAAAKANRQKLAGVTMMAAITASSLFGSGMKSAKAETEVGFYTVQKGDTLTRIAKQYHVSVTELKKENKLVSDKIFIGQKLEVPTHLEVEENYDEIPVQSHKVVSGDTLYRIAVMYGTTVNELKQLNRLSTNTIKIGQTILIPSKEKEISKEHKQLAKFYTVAPGDTMYGLAKRFGTSVDALKGQNGLNTEMILIGQKLLITDTPTVTRAKVIGAIDKFTVEFQTATDTLPLKVSYGTAEAYQKRSGKEYILSYKNGALLSIQSE